MKISHYFSQHMVNTQNFSDSELSAIIEVCEYNGIENKIYTVNSFRHPEYHYLTATDTGNGMMKCAKKKIDRKIVSREQLIEDLKLANYYEIFESKPPAVVVMNDKEKVLNVFCSGAPNYFVFGVENDTYATYSLISNQYWVRSSTNLTQTQMDDMIVVAVGENVFVN